MCGLDKTGAINAVALGDDIGLLGEFGWLRFIGSESFHPNPLGHSLTASTIIKQIGNIMSYDHCGGATICPNGQTSPEPASALLPSGYHGYPEQKNVSFASVLKPIKNRAAKMSNSVNYKISLPDNSFDPGLIVDFQIDNQPDLGQMFIASKTGSLEAEVTVPEDIEELYLVLHLIGPASGKTVDYYQAIRYFMPDYVGGEVNNGDDITDIIVSIYGPNTSFDNVPTVPVTPPQPVAQARIKLSKYQQFRLTCQLLCQKK